MHAFPTRAGIFSGDYWKQSDIQQTTLTWLIHKTGFYHIKALNSVLRIYSQRQGLYMPFILNSLATD